MLIFVAQTRISLEVCTCIYPVRYVDEYSILGANKKGGKKMIIKNREILKCTAASLYISYTSFSIKGEKKKQL